MSRSGGSAFGQSFPSYGAVGGGDDDDREHLVGFRPGPSSGGSVSPEFNQLCEDITSNIFTISSGITTLERARKSLGTQRDTQGLRDQIHLTQMSTNQVVTQTTRDLGRLAAMVPRGEKIPKLKMERLSKDFKTSVERYSTLQKEIASALRRYLSEVTKADDEASGRMEDDMEARQERISTQKQALREEEFNRDMLLERETRIKQIESDMLDLNQIFRELSQMVGEQGEVIDTIESNVERAHGNVEQGAQQLQSASLYQNKYRKKVCYLCSILVVVAIIVIVIIVVNETKK